MGTKDLLDAAMKAGKRIGCEKKLQRPKKLLKRQRGALTRWNPLGYLNGFSSHGKIKAEKKVPPVDG